jgi:hypothetical protein
MMTSAELAPLMVAPRALDAADPWASPRPLDNADPWVKEGAPVEAAPAVPRTWGAEPSANGSNRP